MQIPSITTLIATSIVALFALLGPSPDNLVWLNQPTSQFEPWRWVSGHFVHIGLEHLIWNLLAVLILGHIIERHSKRNLLLSLGAGIIAIDCYLSTLYTMPAYAGLSGVLNTLLVITLFHLYQQPGYRYATLITLIASLAKIIYELYFDSLIVSSLAWPAVPQAHLAGWIAGIILATFFYTEKRNFYIFHKKV